MRKLVSFYNILPLVVLACLSACNDDDNVDNSDFFAANETLEVHASSTSIELDGNEPNKVVLTFDWTEARQMPEEYSVTYVSKLDIEGSDFSTCVRTEEDVDVFSRSYTTEQLQKLLVEKWGRTYTKPATLQFRILAKWDGGSKYAMPEVRTINVDVRPYKPIVFDADKVFLTGDAVTGTTKYVMTQTLENAYQYAALLNLRQGKLQIPVELDGATNYICPEDNEGTLLDGEAETVTMKGEPISWNIPKDGEYRVVVNMEKKTVTIYSPDKQLEPAVVNWMDKNNAPQTTVVTELWLYGDATGWAWWTGNCTQSLADPQVLIYSGQALKNGNGVKFTVDGGDSKNNSYAYSCKPIDENTSQNLSIALGALGDLSGGISKGQRNSYYKIPGGANFIVLDLRNMKIRAEKR